MMDLRLYLELKFQSQFSLSKLSLPYKTIVMTGFQFMLEMTRQMKMLSREEHIFVCWNKLCVLWCYMFI
ncbi:hypothetical protein K2173_002736 [Erythroxylum novogranatense]|uniref:Uncharacterized protein n=1 Tax=Erythroxylum novogranatense TaxID=1862640 RepID=A0AAV8SPV8_9ROSI|nr:hypothetical protein K2173_002736 [Erythroxylum novogranatense]